MDRVNAFRGNNFRLQNEANRDELFRGTEQLNRESRELRRDPLVNAFLDAELALCKLMQKICRTLTEGIDLDIPDILHCSVQLQEVHLYSLLSRSSRLSLCLHNDWKDHRTSLGTFPYVVAECILHCCLNLTPVCDTFIQTSVKSQLHHFSCMIHKVF